MTLHKSCLTKPRTSHRRAFHGRAAHERVSLVGLSYGYTSASTSKPVSSASVPKPVSSASAQEPVSSNPAPEPRRSKRTMSIPSYYAVLIERSPRKPRRDGNV
jgi:hypothetical protein